jgi:hypothetical protein
LGFGDVVRLPNFLGLGTQKGGTTYLHGLLGQHPQVQMASPKEVQFFSLHWHRGLAWYCRHFNDVAPEQCCGEVTPYYLFHPLAAERIQTVLPTTKLIVLLRDPVERSLSQYFHSRRLDLEPLALEAALVAEPGRLADAESSLHRDLPHRSHQQHSYLSRSRYERQLPLYQALFPKAQLLILRSEALFADPCLVWKRVLQFLQLDACPLPEAAPRYGGGGDAQQVPGQLRCSLRSELEPTYNWLQQQGLEVLQP